MRALAILAVWICHLRRKNSHHNPSVKALGVLFELGHTLESGQVRDMNTQARPRLARSHRGRMRRSVPQASTCVQVRRSPQLCRLAAHGVLWNVHHVVPTEEVHWRSRFARDVDVAVRLQRGVASETAKKGLAANSAGWPGRSSVFLLAAVCSEIRTHRGVQHVCNSRASHRCALEEIWPNRQEFPKWDEIAHRVKIVDTPMSFQASALSVQDWTHEHCETIMWTVRQGGHVY